MLEVAIQTTCRVMYSLKGNRNKTKGKDGALVYRRINKYKEEDECFEKTVPMEN